MRDPRLRAYGRWMRCAIAIALSGLMLAGCGKSEQQQAGEQVCAAKMRIAQSVQELGAMADPVAAPNQVQGDFVAMGASLKQMRDAQPKLDPVKRTQVSAAVETFASHMASVLDSLILTQRLGATPSHAKVTKALDELATRYQQTLGTINCG